MKHSTCQHNLFFCELNGYLNEDALSEVFNLLAERSSDSPALASLRRKVRTMRIGLMELGVY